MKKGPNKFFIALITGLMFVFGEAVFLYAQESNSDEFTLEEITVTAQKRVENQQKVPIAMDVISGQTLTESGEDNISDILANQSNAIINMSSSGMKVSLRGLTETEESQWNQRMGTPTVSINVDGALNNGDSAGQNLYDLERVEVLYGPQSTLYGSNSPGGIVNIVTASPKTDRYSASGSVEYGSYKKRTYQGTVNAPIINDKLAMRLALQKSLQGSWTDGGDNSSKTTSARLKTLYQVTDSMSATVTGTWSSSSNGGQRGGGVKPFDYQDGHYADGTLVTNPWTEESDDTATGGMQMSQQANPFGGKQYSKGLSGEYSWDTVYGGISLVPSYSKNHSKQTSSDATFSQMTATGPVSAEDLTETTINETTQKNLELRVTNPKNLFFTYIVGATYYKSQRNNIIDYLVPDSYNYDQTQSTKEINKGIYANITYPVTDKFKVTVGYRQSWDDSSAGQSGSQASNGSQSYNKPDVKYGLEYDYSDNLMLFANYSTSYRTSMAANIARGASTVRQVPAERLYSYTFGAKSRLFDNKVQVNASGFYYDYRNKNFTIESDGRFEIGERGAYTSISESDYGYDFNLDGDTTDTLTSGMYEDPYKTQYASTKNYGVDLSATWIIGSSDRINSSLSYLNAKWNKATVNYLWSKMFDSEGLSLDGKQYTYSPTWSGSLSYQHIFLVGEFGTLTPQLDAQFKSSYRLSYLSDEYWVSQGYSDKMCYQEKYYLLNGSVSYGHSNGNWNLNLYVKNIMNYAVKTYLNDDESLGLNDPRTYGAVLSVKF
jgi:iron complex outermembrane recepter protein